MKTIILMLSIFLTCGCVVEGDIPKPNQDTIINLINKEFPGATEIKYYNETHIKWPCITCRKYTAATFCYNENGVELQFYEDGKMEDYNGFTINCARQWTDTPIRVNWRND